MGRYSLYALIFFCSHFAKSQVLPFKIYSVQDGLISKDITATIRDDRGLLWVGTPFGVNWFDGQKFHTPHLELNTGQLYVTNFFKDSEGGIWTLTFYNGLYRFKNNQFANYLPAATLAANANSVFDMVEIEKNRYLLATDQNIYWFNGSTFTLFDSSRSDLRVQFNSIAYLSDSSILFGNDHGLFWYRFETNRWVFHAKILQDHAIADLFSKGDEVWISTNKGLLYYRKPHLLADGPSEVYLSNVGTGNITKDNRGGIWLVTSVNICQLNNREVTIYSPQNGVPPKLKNIYCDEEGIKWIATGNGLFKLYKEHYRYDNLQQSGVNGLVSQLEIDSDGLSLDRKLMMVWQKKTATGCQSFRKLKGKKIGYVSWLHQSEKKGFYAGTDAGMVEIKNDNIFSRHGVRTTAMYEDDSSAFWLGTVKGRIFLYNNEKLKEVRPLIPHPDFIDGICRDKKGFLWIGYRGSGIKKYHVRNNYLIPVTEFSTNTGFSDLRVRCAFPDKKREYYFWNPN
jgi:ligand-binding sensor domain-containing protein